MKNPILLLLFLLLNGFLHGQIVVSGDSVFVKAGWKAGNAAHYRYSTTRERFGRNGSPVKTEAVSDLETSVVSVTDTTYELLWKYSNFMAGDEKEPVEIPEWKFQTKKTGADPKSGVEDPYVPMEIVNFYGFYGLTLSTKDTSFLTLQTTAFGGDTLPVNVKVYPVQMNDTTITITGSSTVDDTKLRESLLLKYGNQGNDLQKSLKEVRFEIIFLCTMNRKDGNILLLISNQELAIPKTIWNFNTYRYELVTD